MMVWKRVSDGENLGGPGVLRTKATGERGERGERRGEEAEKS